MASTLKELGVEQGLIDEAIAIVATTKNDVLNIKPSLYERIGGEKAVDAAIPIFYKKNLSDARIKMMFEGIDMDRLKKHQKAFMTFALGGPNNYAGKQLATFLFLRSERSFERTVL